MGIMQNLEKYFSPFRKKIIGINQTFNSPYGEKPIVYADWVASGRLYGPIEDRIKNVFGPFVGNTHSESSVTGTTMTQAYHYAQSIIKKHVNANSDDVIITDGSGMTGVVNKFQRILGLKINDKFVNKSSIPKNERPVVFLTHMEHHSNQTSWLETLADVIVIEPDEEGLIDFEHFEQLLEKYKDRPVKFGSFTAASNVTGYEPNLRRLSRMIHEYNGFCFVDYAAAAPYVKIDMHPGNEMERFDAVFFSPHKFIGGPGTSGVLLFNSKLYDRAIPDNPGGGTVAWTNPWGEHQYFNSIEAREDGGTPGFLQTIKTSLCLLLKEEMGVDNILARENELSKKVFERLSSIKKLHLLANNIRERLGIFSFYIEDIHYNLVVKILNDRFGIQMRGGCSCAGTYGHYLLHVDPTRSKKITEKIKNGDLSDKPGWVRFSVHQTMTDKEVDYILDSLEDVIQNISTYSNDYKYSSKTNEFTNINETDTSFIKEWFVCS